MVARGPDPSEAGPLVCPSPPVLLQLLSGQVPPAQAEGFEEHLSSCDACRQVLDREGPPASVLQPWLSRWRWSPPEEPEPAERRLLAWVRQRVPSGSIPEGLGAYGPPIAEPPLPRQIGAYEVVRRAGRGGMGLVFEAVDPRLQRRVALKVLHPEVGSGPDRFAREAAMLAALSHTNIVPIYEVGTHEGRPFLVLEYITGGTLSRWRGDRALAPREAAQALAILARTVQYAHDRGVIHRDLKPSNILLKPRTAAEAGTHAERPPLEAFQLLIADFGLARWQHRDSDLTRSDQLLGTPEYLAPEQLAGGRQTIGPATDIYALGVILYELLTGQTPLKGETVAATLRLVEETEPVGPERLRPELPGDLVTITRKCLEKLPDLRYATARALAEDLERFLDHRPIVAQPVRWPGRLVRWCRRNRGLAGLAALSVGLSLTLALGGLAVLARQQRQARETEQLRADALARFRQAQASQDAAARAQAQNRKQMGESALSLSVLTERLSSESPGGSGWVGPLREAGLRRVITWAEQYLTSFGSIDDWTVKELQLALMLARLHTELGHFDRAAPLRQQVRQAGQRLVQADPGAADAVMPLTGLLFYEALQAFELESAAVAQTWFAQADRVLAAYAQRRPEAGPALRRRFQCLHQAAAALNQLNRVGQGLPPPRVDTPAGWVRGPSEAWPLDWQVLWAFLLGRGRLELGHNAEALVAFDQGLKLLEQIPAGSASAAVLASIRHACLEDRALAFERLGQPEPARADRALQESLAHPDGSTPATP